MTVWFVLLGTSCAHTGAQLGEARALMAQRRLSRAAGLLEAAAATHPGDAEAALLLGECLFRQGRFGEAGRWFGEALLRNPRNLEAGHRLWAARLQAAWGSPEEEAVREEVRADVESVARAGRERPELLLQAAAGAGYLRDDILRRSLLLTLARSGWEPGEPEETSLMVLQEIVGAGRDAEGQADLASYYLSNFRGFRGEEAAAWALVSALRAESPGPEEFLSMLHDVLDAHTGNAHLNHAAAHRLVEEDLALPLAREFLMRNLELLPDLAGREPPGLWDPVLWEMRLKHREASWHRLLGRIALMEGKPREAAGHLARALDLDPEDGRTHRWLGQTRLVQGRGDDAVRHLIVAAEMLGPDSEAAKLVVRILKDQGSGRMPLAAMKGVAAFQEVTPEGGLPLGGATDAAWGDYDRDGDPDLLTSGPRLYRNREARFEDVTETTGLGGVQGCGGAWGDYDGDGFPDLYLFCRQEDHLLHNEGGERFKDVTETALGVLPSEPGGSAAWGDADGDGRLDVYVANYERPGVELGICAPDRLWRNLGDGRFEDATRAAGVVTDEPFCGRHVLWTDLTGDGLPDITVSNYRLDPNLLWVSRGDGTFVERARDLGVRGTQKDGSFGHTLGMAAGDLTGDGRVDLVVANLAHPRYRDLSDASQVLLWEDGRFTDATERSGVRYAETHARPALADVDGDGDLDLYLAALYEGRRSFLYLNDGAGRFTDVTWLSGTWTEDAWDADFADVDGDGDPDLVVASPQGVRLFRNDGLSASPRVPAPVPGG